MAAHETDIAELSRRFRVLGEIDCHGYSPLYERLAYAIAEDHDVLELLARARPGQRRPVLLLAAVNYLGGMGEFPQFRQFCLDHRDDVLGVVETRATQTNEVGRCATLLPVLAALPQPLALLEVGASAGLCLYPERYSYRWSDGTALDPADGPSEVLLRCEVHGDPPLPATVPEVAWRAGVDLNPLDVGDDDAVRWLETLVWPEHEERRQRLRAAVDVVRRDPPRIVRGDALESLPALVDTVPDDATLVVFHSAVLAYFGAEERTRFAALARDLPGHWVSNEGPRVVDVTGVPEQPPPWGAPFVLALDGRFVAWTEGHGRRLWWPTGSLGSPHGS